MPRQTKVKAEEKVTIVRKYLKGKYSIQEAAREAGVDRATVKAWIQQYEAEGVSAFQQGKNRHYAQELTMQAVKDYLEGKGSLFEICKRHELLFSVSDFYHSDYLVPYYFWNYLKVIFKL